MHPSEKIQRILNQSLKCSYAQTEVICSLYVHYVTASLWNNNICNLNSLKVPISLCTKLRLAARFRPDSLGELTALHRPFSCIGEGEEEGEGDGKGGRGREGRRGEGRAGERKMNETRMLFA